MAGRAHEAENIFTVSGELHRVERGGGGSAGVIRNVFKKRRVSVEVLRDFQSREHFGRVRAENLRVGNFCGGNPLN